MLREMNNKLPAGMLSICVQMGEVNCAITVNETEEFEYLKSLYGDYLTDKPIDITLELNLHNRINTGQNAQDSDSEFTADYSEENNTISVHLVREPGDPRIDMTIMNRLLYRAYYSSVKIRQYPGRTKPLLIHACAVLLSGRVVLFIGPCGAGKSTVAKLLGESGAEVINDEMVIASRRGQKVSRILIHGTPIIGDYPKHLNIEAPLDCVMILKKSPRTAISPINQTEAYTKFLRQIITPSYIGQIDDKAVLSTMADFTGELTALVPFHVLEFNLDSEILWHEINHLKKI
jgi:hypothetical protein